VTGFHARVWRPATRAASLDSLRIHDLRHTAVALWIAAGANPKEIAARAGHASVSFTLDRYGHLYPEADTALRGRLDARYGTTQPAPEGNVVRLIGGPGVAPVWPQASPGTTRASPMTHRRRSDLLGCGVEVRGFEPLASSVRVSGGRPLCGPAFAQVASNRQGRSWAFRRRAAETGSRSDATAYWFFVS
jgi:hypothetical protein